MTSAKVDSSIAFELRANTLNAHCKLIRDTQAYMNDNLASLVDIYSK